MVKNSTKCKLNFIKISYLGTAIAKDSEVIKKVHGFWVIQLKS